MGNSITRYLISKNIHSSMKCFDIYRQNYNKSNRINVIFL